MLKNFRGEEDSFFTFLVAFAVITIVAYAGVAVITVRSYASQATQEPVDTAICRDNQVYFRSTDQLLTINGEPIVC